MKSTAHAVHSSSANSPYAIEFREVSFSYSDRPVLDRISFGVRQGELKCVLGGSGSGKSTILRLALRLIEPDSGTVLVNGVDITHLREEALGPVRREMGMIFQGGALFDSLTVHDNVAYRLVERHWDEERIEQEVRRQLDFMDFEGDLDALPADLSGGMRRAVAIARAMAGGPQILLYDEPTTGLDPTTAKIVCELAAKLRDTREVSSIFVTHRLHDLKFLSSVLYLGGEPLHRDERDFCVTNTTVMILRHGQVYFDGTDEQLRAQDDPYLREFLGLVEDEEEDE
jgi:phospholipid/cholesterol/gamma-HCH transport system ATP-binding protein